MRRAALVPVLACALTLSGSEAISSPQKSPVPQSELRNISSGDVDTAFGKLQTYWRRQGVGAVSTRLAFLQGKQTVTCNLANKQVTINADQIALEYCPTSNTIIVSELGFKVLNFFAGEDIKPEPLAELVIGHEYGHGVQEAKKENLTRVKLELEADCYSGEALAGINSPAIQDAATFYGIIGRVPGTDHGTPMQRYLSFEEGALFDTCDSLPGS